ncbi:YihY/virulence factor BrkB family protein [Acidicapsa ligni]|uniref:YihY/virulence factor BrkB family protein n=1 Tax=Acidicapsa ligni TaxID=542300 RepID=UPI0021E05879|nr:YihY/virulence factor BrkB family protein [Acidicapsa ligni]
MGVRSRHLRSAVRQAWQNDVVNTAKAAAYSGMLMLFPAFLVLTTLLALVPQGNALLDVIRTTAEQFLPADTMSLLQSYFVTRRAYSLQVMLSATSLSSLAGLGMMLTIMEGFRRAYRLPRDSWCFWKRQLRALMLLPIAFVPLSLATLLLIFGHSFEIWMINNSDHEILILVVLFWRFARWTLAALTSITVLGTLYHFGTRSKEHWHCIIPGAIAATLLWFPATLAFGWYVTRIADYSMLYGSLGTGIATLVWLYITSFSVLLGAELNGVLYRERQAVWDKKLPGQTPLI